MTHAFSKAITVLFDLLMAPFSGNATAALTVISLLAGVAMIFIFKATSDQDGIKRTRDLFKARILEMRIYQDDIVLILKALGAALWSNALYLRVSVRPILALAAFALFIFIQLDERFGRAPLEPGQTALVTVTLKDGADIMAVPVSIETSIGAAVNSPPVRVPSRREISWRLKAITAGRHAVTLNAYDKNYVFDLTAEPGTGVVGHMRSSAKLDGLIHLGMPKLRPDAPIASVVVRYPSADYSLLWWKTHWLVVFIVWSFVGALIPKFIFKIQV